MSTIVTKAIQVTVCPLESVTVKVTLLTPILVQVKAVCEAEIEAMLISSVLPPSISEALIVAFPDVSSWAV